jgi:hypothetical protein
MSGRKSEEGSKERNMKSKYETEEQKKELHNNERAKETPRRISGGTRGILKKEYARKNKQRERNERKFEFAFPNFELQFEIFPQHERIRSFRGMIVLTNVHY